MEDEGTPPAATRLLTDEAESPSYHGSRSGRARTQPGFSTRRGWPKDPSMFPGFNGPAGRQDPSDVVRLLEENWYWQSNPTDPGREYADAWQSSKANRALDRQRSLRYGALRSTISQGNNAVDRSNNNSISARISNSRDSAGLLRRDVSATSRTSEALSNADSDVSESERWDASANSASEVNPEDVDSLGTWAQRVLFFPSNAEKQKKAAQDQQQAQVQEAQVQAPDRTSNHLRRRESKEEDDAAHAAWRWRFNRRWRNEQAKQFDPEFGMDGDDEDGWEDALRHLDACGPGVHLQIGGRLSSDKRDGSLKSTSSGGMGVLFDDSLRDKSLASEADNATSNIASKARKVQELYQNQKKIEREAKARWGNTAVSVSWAGSHVRAVDIDNYGHFRFILARLTDHTKAHRLIVRGRSNSSQKELLKSLTTEVEEVCSKRRLPMVKIQVLGTGSMEWSRDKDHCINVSQGVMAKGCEAIRSNDDVVRVAGALTRTSLPGPARVTVNGEKLS